jgi:hypothetical protein
MRRHLAVLRLSCLLFLFCPFPIQSSFPRFETSDYYPSQLIFQIEDAIQAYDSGFSAETTAEAKARYAERIERIRVEKFQHLYDFLCDKPYYRGGEYFV